MPSSGANRAGFTMRGSPTVHPVREWSALEDRYLRLQWWNGVKAETIADKLHRTEKSVRGRAKRKGFKRCKTTMPAADASCHA